MLWKPIPGYSQYDASSEGHIRNNKTNYSTKGGNAGRYLKVSVFKDHVPLPHLEYVHILVCKAFHGLPISASMVVMHLDDDRFNNTPTNLRWGTVSENTQSAYDNGLINRSRVR